MKLTQKELIIIDCIEGYNLENGEPAHSPVYEGILPFETKGMGLPVKSIPGLVSSLVQKKVLIHTEDSEGSIITIDTDVLASWL